MKSITNLDSSVYYHGHYWNDVPEVSKYINKRLTGDETVDWIVYFKENYAEVPFKHALFLNCGDGRWEREFIDSKIVKKVTAFDISPDLIAKAKKAAGKRNIKYFVADANKVSFKKDSFDLIVNMAALHHVQYLNRLCFLIAKSLKPEGLFLNYDFVGPHRNQYPLVNWLSIRVVNKTLPGRIKKLNLGYPHLPTMLISDPTEAIHSDLIKTAIKKYFTVMDEKNAGGGIAYEIFTHNDNFFKNYGKTKGVASEIKKVLAVDSTLTDLGIVPTFFSLIIAKPNKSILVNNNRNKKLKLAEVRREKISSMLYNTYTLKDYALLFIFCGSWRKRLEMTIRYIKILPKLLS